ESCEECLKQRLEILLQVTGGAWCGASADARSNFIMTRAGPWSCSCSRVGDPGWPASPMPATTVQGSVAAGQHHRVGLPMREAHSTWKQRKFILSFSVF